jgi:hypothetical protein
MNASFNRVIFATATAAALALPIESFALSNSAKVPVLLYHSVEVQSPCDYANNASTALAADLEALNLAGFTVVPTYWIAEWARGARDGSTLPAKVVGLTFDDGVNTDWIDNAIPNHPCAPLVSFKTVMQNFKAAHPSLPWYSPHAGIFVIGSTMARLRIDDDSFPPPYGTTGVNNFMHDTWWAAANSSGLAEIYNHSADHDANSIQIQHWDSDLGMYIAVGGYGDGNWAGTNWFYRIDTQLEATYEVVNSAAYISSKTGAWPDLFAYPFGHASTYMKGTFFPNNVASNGTYAAFCIEQATTTLTYVTRSSDPYCLGRFTRGVSWTTPSGFAAILSGAP